MCFATSYELSMLAFVVVGPIMYLWDLYGNWSKSLSRRVLAAWAEANANHETLGALVQQVGKSTGELSRVSQHLAGLMGKGELTEEDKNAILSLKKEKAELLRLK